MVRLANVFPDLQIAQTLSAQLSWCHFTEIIRLGDLLKRDFYAEMSRIERLRVRTLRHKIDHLLFERTAVSQNPDELLVDRREFTQGPHLRFTESRYRARFVPSRAYGKGRSRQCADGPAMPRVWAARTILEVRSAAWRDGHVHGP